MHEGHFIATFFNPLAAEKLIHRPITPTFTQYKMSIESTSLEGGVDGFEDSSSGDCLDVAEPFRFNFEIAWEVAHKGQSHIAQPLLLLLNPKLLLLGLLIPCCCC